MNMRGEFPIWEVSLVFTWVDICWTNVNLKWRLKSKFYEIVEWEKLDSEQILPLIFTGSAVFNRIHSKSIDIFTVWKCVLKMIHRGHLHIISFKQKNTFSVNSKFRNFLDFWAIRRDLYYVIMDDWWSIIELFYQTKRLNFSVLWDFMNGWVLNASYSDHNLLALLSEYQ